MGRRLGYVAIAIAASLVALDASAQDAGVADASPEPASDQAFARDAIEEPPPEPQPTAEPPPPEPAPPSAPEEPPGADEEEAIEEELAAADIVEELDIHLHGFASQGFMLTVENNWLASGTTHGSFELAEAALNVTSQPLDDLRIGIQLFARDLGPTGNYGIKLDWFYVDYRFNDWLGIRAGRTKIPFGLYNELNDVDVARVPVLLPQSTYPISNRDFLLAQTGVELYALVPLGESGGVLDARLYGGTIFLEVPAAQPGSPFTLVDLTVPFIVGGRLLWETPLTGLRLGGSAQVLQLDTHLLDAMQMPAELTIHATLWVASLEYAVDELLLATEYGRWHVDSDSTLPGFGNYTESERAYVMGSYRVASWLTPGLYYSLLFGDVDDREGRDARQHDVALTLRFDVNAHWLIKVEGHYLNGTSGLSASLNDGTPARSLSTSWAAFFVKTTGYF